METLGNIFRFIGLLVALGGMWQLAGGLRVVVSGRLDERRRSAKSIRLGLPLFALGLILLFGGSWLANWARMR